jgi:hypothetical protein
MEQFRNHGLSDPKLYEQPAYVAFDKKVAALTKPGTVVTERQFLDLAKEAVNVKKVLPMLRADIAYDMVCLGSCLETYEYNVKEPEGVVKEVWDLFADLEVPDGHVVSPEAAERDDFSEVDEKWQRIESLIS